MQASLLPNNTPTSNNVLVVEMPDGSMAEATAISTKALGAVGRTNKHAFHPDNLCFPSNYNIPDYKYQTSYNRIPKNTSNIELMPGHTNALSAMQADVMFEETWDNVQQVDKILSVDDFNVFQPGELEYMQYYGDPAGIRERAFSNRRSMVSAATARKREAIEVLDFTPLHNTNVHTKKHRALHAGQHGADQVADGTAGGHNGVCMREHVSTKAGAVGTWAETSSDASNARISTDLYVPIKPGQVNEMGDPSQHSDSNTRVSTRQHVSLVNRTAQAPGVALDDYNTLIAQDRRQIVPSMVNSSVHSEQQTDTGATVNNIAFSTEKGTVLNRARALEDDADHTTDTTSILSQRRHNKDQLAMLRGL